MNWLLGIICILLYVIHRDLLRVARNQVKQHILSVRRDRL